MNDKLVNNDHVIDILDDVISRNERMSDSSSVTSDNDIQDIKKNTKLNTLINTHAALTAEDLKRLQKFYSANNKNNNNGIENDLEDDIKREIIEKLAVFIFIVILGIPITFCDLYYGYGSNSCVNDYPKSLNINMKEYLIINAYYSILSYIVLRIIHAFTKNKDNLNSKLVDALIQTFIILFLSTWNIIGAVIFWGTLYKEDKCDKNISTYLFITLIVKLLVSAFALNRLKNKISDI